MLYVLTLAAGFLLSVFADANGHNDPRTLAADLIKKIEEF